MAAVAVMSRTRRRFIADPCAMGSPAVSRPAQLGGGVENGADDLVVAGAAAEVAGEPVADLAFRRIRTARQQGLGGDQHPRRAVPALDCGMLAVLPLQRVVIR